MQGEASPLGLLSFLSFCFSIIGAVLAIDMYRLLRTGEYGRTWRLLIIATVIFALLQVLRLAETLEFRPVDISKLVQIVELCFVISLAYAFYLQRKLFTNAITSSRRRTDKDYLDENEAGDDEEYSPAKYGAYEADEHENGPASFRDDTAIDEWPETAAALETHQASKQ